MYRLISAEADTYITSKIVENSRSLDTNVGQAGTIDIYKLYNESELSGEDEVIELSRGLIKFDYSGFSNLVNVQDPSFKATLKLKNVYGGQTTPSNFTLVVFPLSKSFDEGRGFDVSSYKDIDTSNFLKCSSGEFWVSGGAGAKGNAGEDVDVIQTADFGDGTQCLASYCQFNRGDEDAVFDVTTLVSASIAGHIENKGFRLSFRASEESDDRTRFVKRFASRQALSKELHPKLIIEYDDRVLDTSAKPIFGVVQNFYTYNVVAGNYTDFTSASAPVNNLQMQLIASKSVFYTTSSFQANFNQVIEYSTSSLVYFSQSFSASKVDEGKYLCNFTLDPTTNSDLSDFITDPAEVGFDLYWKSLDGTVTFSKKFVKFNTSYGGFSNSAEPNYFINITNLKQEYSFDQSVRMKVFIQDRTAPVTVTRALESPKCTTLPDMRWRLRKAYSKTIIVPFAESTRLSSDAENMYFDIYMNDLDINEVYEIEFIIKTDQGKDILVSSKGFTFKVIQ